MIRAAITAVGAYTPDDVLTNEDISAIVDTTDEWITTRVGIKERRVLKDKNKGTSYMGIEAVKQVLKKTNTKPEEVQAIIFATTTPDHIFPSTAAVTAEACGIKNALGFDVQAACAGFIYALEIGSNFVRSGNYKKVIVVSGDKMTAITNYKDRTTCPLFGDACGAVMLEPTEEEVGVMDSILHVDGVGLPYLHMYGGGSLHPASHETVDNDMHYVYQEGQVVFKYAVSRMADVSVEIMERNHLTKDMVAWLVPHQANIRIIEAVGNRMGLAPEKVMVNIQKYGNTSAGTIPLCLCEWESRLKKGDNIILTAFGAGFTWGAVYLKWAY
jgi:3-oxoacyl-[acyl-carrier-protein] synthase-3